MRMVAKKFSSMGGEIAGWVDTLPSSTLAGPIILGPTVRFLLKSTFSSQGYHAIKCRARSPLIKVPVHVDELLSGRSILSLEPPLLYS